MSFLVLAMTELSRAVAKEKEEEKKAGTEGGGAGATDTGGGVSGAVSGDGSGGSGSGGDEDTSAEEYWAEAVRLMGEVMKWMDDPSLLGRSDMAGVPATSTLAPPMIRLSLLQEMHSPRQHTGDSGDGGGAESKDGGGGGGGGDGTVTSRARAASILASPDYPKMKQCVDEILLHRQPELQPPLVLENVTPEGGLIDTIEGRMHNPGHSIEASWFLLRQAMTLEDAELQATAIEMLDWSFEAGWDTEHGGIYYFLDREGYSPTELEWNMKLWCE